MHPTKDDRPSIHFLFQSLHHDYYIRIEYIAHELEILHILVVEANSFSNLDQSLYSKSMFG